MKSSKNKQLLEHDGFVYRFDKPISGGRKKSWRCMKKGCLGRLHTDSSDGSPVSVGTHDHSADPLQTQQYKFRSDLRSESARTTRPIPAIYDGQVASAAASGLRALPHLPYKHVKSSMYRSRNKLIPPLPADTISVPTPLPQAFSETSANQRFLLFQLQNNAAICFATDESLSLLERSPEWYMDGTFDSAPSPFGQLFTVHVFFGDKQLPAVFVLMESKSAQLYNDVFSELILQAAMKGVTLRPTTVVSDFETGLLTSVKQVFPAAKHRGCYFHFCQAVIRNLGRHSVRELYMTDADFNLYVRKLLALAFLPPAIVRINSGPIISHIVRTWPSARPFVTYFSRQWFDQCPPHFWSVYGIQRRTNNDLESWHMRFNRRVGRYHPNLWQFISFLKEEQAVVDSARTQLLQGHVIHRTNKKYARLNERLEKLSTEYRAGTRTADELLLGVAHNISPDV